MEVLYERCAGLDVHKDSVVVCMRMGSGTSTRREHERFGTTTKALMALSDWLTERGCTHVVMGSTGVYWKPVWHMLDGAFELTLANAHARTQRAGPQDGHERRDVASRTFLPTAWCAAALCPTRRCSSCVT